MKNFRRAAPCPRSGTTRIGAASFLLFLFWISGARAETDSSREFLYAWLGEQAKIATWSADVIQVRNLKSLTRPLKSRGRVWFRLPNRFRWQLGEPPRTIAVRRDEELLVIYPRLKQVERFVAGEDVDPAWRQALALLEVGFPRDADTFFAQYTLVSTQRLKKSWKFELKPASELARRLLDRVTLEIATKDYALLATQLTFPDGSTMTNQFVHRQINPGLDEGLFDFDIEEGYTVVNPLKPGP